jgi:DNA-binding NarL/FixJ family response regulator
MRLLLADDHPVFLEGLRTLLGGVPDADVVAEAHTGPAAVAEARRQRPDVVLMDVDLPGLDGIEATRQILAASPQTSVLILTMLGDDDTMVAAVRAGARGYLLKGAGRDDIARAIDAVGRGEAIFGPQVASRVFDVLARPAQPATPFPELTDRERAVLTLVAEGKTNLAIARELGLSVKTVRNYLSRIFAKLQVTHRTEAAVRARREGLAR